MKLWYSPPSPFVRKVLMLAYETGQIDKLELVDVTNTALTPDAELAKLNPLGKIPTLILEDGHTLFDSRVISEYLDGLHDGKKMLPAEGMDRYNTLVCQPSATNKRFDQRSFNGMSGWMPSKRRSYKPWMCLRHGEQGYLDFRQPDFNWREGRPVLTQMLATFSERESMAKTQAG